MSGQLVMTVHGDLRSFYMVNLADPKDACGAVDQLTGTNEAHALAPVSAETLEHYQVRPRNPWLYRSDVISTGEVAFSRLDETAL
jgi:hypothetical protein